MFDMYCPFCQKTMEIVNEKDIFWCPHCKRKWWITLLEEYIK